VSAVAFAAAIVLSVVGNFFGEESAAQTVLFALSSVALATGAACAAVALATGPHGRAAAGLGILVVAEGVLWAGGATGPTSHTALAAGELFYAPALALLSSSSWPPPWSRVASGAASGCFGLHALLSEAGSSPADTISDVAFVLLAVALAGFIVSGRAGSGPLEEPTRAGDSISLRSSWDK
jgi:hypothetical protein